ncbi:MAG: flagellar biosynthesis protein FliQ [Francisellaceae bacterium]
MEQSLAIYFTKQMLWQAMLIGAPIVITALIVGVIISIIQVVTQIQDSTLSFIPKIIAVTFVVMLAAGWMLSTLENFATSIIANIPNYL